MTVTLPSTKPYLIRALHEWCTDNGFTPYVTVAVDERTRVPREFVRDGQIVLNIGYEATGGLKIDNDMISFQARFGGIARDLSFPVGNVTAVYARENGAGMSFEIDPPDDARSRSAEEAGEEVSPDTPPPSGGRPKLMRIK